MITALKQTNKQKNRVSKRNDFADSFKSPEQFGSREEIESLDSEAY